MRAFGSRSAISEGIAKPPKRMEMLRLSGPPASIATHVTRRPISSQVPSMNSPSGLSRPRTRRQIASTSASSYWRSTLNARTITGWPGTGISNPPTGKLSPSRSSALAARTRSGSISIPATRTSARTADNRSKSSTAVAGEAPYPRSMTNGSSARRSRHACGPVSHRSRRRIRLGLVVPRVTLPTGLPPLTPPRAGAAVTRSAFCTTGPA